MSSSVDPGNLFTVASVITGFGIAMLFFRIQRELHMHQQGERIWIPYADWLLIIATLISLLLVLTTIIVVGQNSPWAMKLAIAASGFVVILVAGYILAILAHYRLIFGGNRAGKRKNPEPSEKVIVLISFIIGIIIGIASIP